MAVTAAARTRPRDAATGPARTITAFLVAKPEFPGTEVLEIRRGLNSDSGPGKLLALVDDHDAATAALQGILATRSSTRTPRGAVNQALPAQTVRVTCWTTGNNWRGSPSWPARWPTLKRPR